MTSSTQEKVLCTRFNQDNSFVALGTTLGYRVYCCEPFACAFSSKDGGVRHVGLLHSSSLVALVGSGEQASSSPRCLTLMNTKTSQKICSLDFETTILNVLMNSSRLVVVLEERICIFDLSTVKKLHTLDTACNPGGVAALSPNDKIGYLVYPASEDKGDLLVFDAQSLQQVAKVNAHQSSVRALAFNRLGNMIATASEVGTIVRVFSLPTGEMLNSFRRGMKAATVLSMSFSPSSRLLALAGTSNTVHVFNLKPASQSEASAVQSTLAAAMSTVSAFVPAMKDVLEPSRAYAWLWLKDDAERVFCGFGSDSESVLQIATSGGYLYSYSIPATGGECRLRSQHSLNEFDDVDYVREYQAHDDLSLGMGLGASMIESLDFQAVDDDDGGDGGDGGGDGDVDDDDDDDAEGGDNDSSNGRTNSGRTIDDS